MANIYKQKYRKAVKQVTMWMADDDMECEMQPMVDESVTLPDHDHSDDTSNEICEQFPHDAVEKNENGEESGVSGVMYDEELPLSSSDDESDSHLYDTGDALKTDLAEFMVSEHLTRQASNKLIALLRKHGHDLPKDCRTLTNTPRVINVVNKCGGQYVYFGVKKCLQMAESSCDAFHVTVNIDGIPVFKSSNVQFWPILCVINSLPPTIIALYVGSTKPTPVDEFLADFVHDMEELQSTGFVVTKGVIKPVVLRGFVCDAPARAFIKNIKGHNSLSGCERCLAVGVSTNSRTTFSSAGCYSAEKRRHDKFVNLDYAGSHQLGGTPLCRIASDCINMCALDYLHLVCLGAVRRILMYWKKGDRRVKLSSSQLMQLSEKLIGLRDFIPSEFARRPRSIAELDRWKATEYRQFLLYTGPVVLKSVLPADLYKHFLCLSVSVSIMLTSNRDQREHYLDFACELMHHFVSNCDRFYGIEFLVYNIHSLLHLGDDVKFFEASLDDISAFPFENFLQTLKRLVRSPSNPIAQVAKRIHEFESVGMPLTGTSPAQKQSKLAANNRDCVVLLKSGKFAEIVDNKDDVLTCAVYRKACLRPFFTEPCSSDIFNIVFVETSGSTYITDVMEIDIERKAMRLPYRDGYVLMPLVHNE